MSATISLRSIVGELSFMMDGFVTYLNKETGAIVTVSQEDLDYVENEPIAEDDEEHDGDARALPGWEPEAAEEVHAIVTSDDYLKLPSKFDVHEYAIMEEFCYTIGDDDRRFQFLNAIHGSGAFRRFKDTLHYHNMADDWYRFRDNALKKIAVEWLEDNSLKYIDDTKEQGTRHQ
ncbi:MAG: hypothetical protein JXB07_17010 [Anaerolineae bacterium]|nr:hypothetical protein [Anaerolineae bacterium]